MQQMTFNEIPTSYTLALSCITYGYSKFGDDQSTLAKKDACEVSQSSTKRRFCWESCHFKANLPPEDEFITKKQLYLGKFVFHLIFKYPVKHSYERVKPEPSNEGGINKYWPFFAYLTL